MLLSGLTFAKVRGAARLDFATRTQKTVRWATIFVQAVLLGLSAILFAKAFLVDYPAADSFLAPTTIMSLECASFLSVACFFYWLLSGVHLRVTSCRRWQVDAAFAAGVLAVGVTAFVFGYGHGFTNVALKYVYTDLLWFAVGLLGVSLVPWAGGLWHILRTARPLRTFALAGLLLRALMVAALVIAILYFDGTSLYDQAVTERILAVTGFNSALNGFVSILWIVLFLVAFAAAIGLLVLTSLSVDTFLKSTTPVRRPLLTSVAVSALISLTYAAMAITGDTEDRLVWIVLGTSLGLSLAFLALNLLLKIRGLPEVLRTLAICLQLLVVITVAFALEYFLPSAETARAAAFVLTLPALLLTAAHLVCTGVARGTLSQRPLTLVLSAAGSAAVTYVFLTGNGFADLLPREVPVRTMFNFILIAAVLFSAVYACGRLLLASNAATRLLALRAAGV